MSSFIYFSTPIALLIGWGERPGWVTLIGGAIVVVGVFLTNTRARASERSTAQPAYES